MRSGEKYFILLLFILNVSYTAKSQSQFQIWSGNLGGPLYKQSFGTGSGDVNSAGPALPAGITTFSYSNDVCPPTGSYSIVQKINVNNCSDNKWLSISLDHRQEPFGNMMLVHNIDSNATRIVYVDTVKEDLCAGTLYEFSAAIINADALASCSSNPDFPNLKFSLEDALGNELQSYNTREIPAAPAGTSAGQLWKYSVYGFDYTLPVNLNRIVLKISLLRANSYGNCNNDFAIDDILFSPAGPVVNIAFAGLPPGSSITELCFQDNKNVLMTGNMDPFYANPAFQWQETSDNGITWKDIPGATNTSYSQNFPVADTFLFRLRGSDASIIKYPGCGSVSNELKVRVNGLPSGLEAGSNSPVCAGQVINLEAKGGAAYFWTGPNGYFNDIAEPRIYNSSFADSGTYYVTIETLGGCKGSASTHVKMIGFAVKVVANQFVCKGQSVQLYADGGTRYLWSPTTGLSNTTTSDPRASPEKTTTYSVKVTDESGCSDTGSVVVRLLNSIAVKAIISSPGVLCRSYDSASFKDMSLGKIKSWSWDFGNGRKSITQDPAAQVYSIDANTTNYTVRLAIKDTAGCADTAYQLLKVEGNCYIAVPSAFTPNGDGINDYLYPLNAYKATHLLFRVFDRHGQQVFETRDWTKKWDGTLSGNPLTTDIFIWEMGYTDASGKKIFLKGSTLLIR